MTEFISNSPHRAWLQSYEVQINYSHINFVTSLKGVASIYQFVTTQAEGFTKHESLPAELDRIKERFINAKGGILKLVSQEDLAPVRWSSVLRNITAETTNNERNYLYDSPEVLFLIQVSEQIPELYLGVYQFFSGSISHYNDKNHFSGYVLAHDFKIRQLSKLSKRVTFEASSYNELKSTSQTLIQDIQSHSISHIAEANRLSIEYASTIDDLKKSKEKSFDDWFSQSTSSFQQFTTTSSQRISEFETLYQDKLKLEAPAKYWNERAKRLRKGGYKWLAAFCTSVIFAVLILVWIIGKISSPEFKHIFSDTGIAVKWSITIITLISFLAYLMRIFSKMTFSSFHLVRDAEEREQLTYVYLALQKEKSIDQTERHLIMQSLFSRADSGLLKDDASPTMPGNIVDQIAKR